MSHILRWLAAPLALALVLCHAPADEANRPPPKAAYDLTGGFRVAHFGKDGGVRALLLIHDDRARRYEASVADLVSGKVVSGPMAHDHAIQNASFSPDGTRVVTSSWDKTAVWDAATGGVTAGPLKHEGVSHAAFSPDGTRVVTASWDKTACVWDATTGKLLVGPLKNDSEVFYALFSPDGTRIVTQCYGSATLWDAATGKLLGRATVN